ncbi:unnamed protein product, partial [marine sediment metagenome]
MLSSALRLLAAAFALSFVTACGSDEMTEIQGKVAQYTSVRLTADLSLLTEAERQMLPLLMEAAQVMDEIYWQEAYGDRGSFMASLSDPDMEVYRTINFGPWDRIGDNEPFVPGVGAKPAGANFYPSDMTREEFEVAAAAAPDGGEALRSLYTLVRRDADGSLMAVPYREAFAEPNARAAEKLREAAALAEDPGLRRYLSLRADALLTDEYQPSD